MNRENNDDGDIEAIIGLLDGFAEKQESRMKLEVVEGKGDIVSKKYHHGRCDVGSPWAKGKSFDVLE